MTLRQLTDVVQDFEFPFLLDHRINRSLILSPNGHLLPEAYLAVVEVDYWRSRLQAAEEPDSAGRAAVEGN